MADDKRTKMGTGPVAAQPAPTALSEHQTSYVKGKIEADPLLGQTLAGRYAIVRKLGEGGMGSVYLATHKVLEKQIALKVLHGEFARKPDLVERFMQEAKSASRIRHENVIDISDFGTTPEGLVFFAMELLQGHDLHEDIARARLAGQLLPWSRSKKIFLQICGALSAAHAKGIVHRDLKPENVYLVDFLGDPDFVKLLDFGIAKLTEVNEGDRKLTRTGMLFGTPEYMSPEQARGEHVDARVDVYAMGCILFQLISGRVPFEADNFMGVLSLHLTEPPPTIAPETFDRIGAPRELAGVIAKALEKDRNARFQTIDELANAVRRVCGDLVPTQQQRAASVPAPERTTHKSGEVAQIPPNITPTPGGRVRTQWTGKVSVPTEGEAVAQQTSPRSKLPLILGGILVVAAGGIAAFVIASKKHDQPTPVTQPSGSQIASQVATVTPDAAVVAIDAALALPPPPEKVTIRLDSKPRGAEITDLSSKTVIGKTPLTFKLPGSHTPRQFALHYKDYTDAVVEIVPDEVDIKRTETLERATVVRTGSGSARPTGSGSSTGSAGSATQPPPPTPPDAAPKQGPVDPGCLDDDDLTPCLKDPLGSGGH